MLTEQFVLPWDLTSPSGKHALSLGSLKDEVWNPPAYGGINTTGRLTASTDFLLNKTQQISGLIESKNTPISNRLFFIFLQLKYANRSSLLDKHPLNLQAVNHPTEAATFLIHLAANQMEQPMYMSRAHRE